MSNRRLSYGTALLLAAGLLVTGPARAQVLVWHEQWNPGGSYWTEIAAMGLTPEGDVVATGRAQSETDRYFATVRFASANADVVWARAFKAPSYAQDWANDIAVDRDGNSFVCGMSATLAQDRSDWVVLKYGPEGDFEWDVVYSNGLVSIAAAVLADDSGGCYVAGRSAGDLVVAHYDADGNATWLTRLAGEPGGEAAANALAACTSGYLYAAGYRWTGTEHEEAYWLVKLDPATGDTAWTRTYDGSADPWDARDDRAYAVAIGPGGNVYVTGKAGEYGTAYDATTVAWDPAGNRLWVNRFDSGRLQNDAAAEIAVSADGHVYCGGFTFDYSDNSGQDFLVLRIRPDGEPDWFRVWDGSVWEDDSCTGLVLDAYGNVYATGVIGGPMDDEDWMVVKYNPAGQQVWRTAPGVPDEVDIPNAILLDRHGDIYVGGMDVQDFALRKYGQHDAAAFRIVAPTDTLRVGAEVWPRAWVVNNSPQSTSFGVWCYIGNFYFDLQSISGLAPRDSVLVEFRPWEVRDVGEHRVVFYTALFGDQQPQNDSVSGTVTTVPVWEQLAPMPFSATGRQREVRDGGALVVVDDTLVFGFKGSNTTEFYRYSVLSDSWVPVETIPSTGSTGRRRRVRKGASLAADDQGRIFALKGNNTLEFWRYIDRGDSSGWTELRPYPAGTRRVRGGGGLIYVEAQNRLYSAKGSNTFEFYAYDIATDSWLTLADAHPGPRNRKLKDGSCMAYDGDNTIYLLKGRTQEFAAYSISADAWTAKPEVPYSALARRNKVNLGAGLGWDPTAGRVYASKGRRSSEWWYFDVARDVWVEATWDTIPMGPSNRQPGKGSATASGGGRIYFLKGNKTVEFWRYNADLPLNPGGGLLAGVMTLPAEPARSGPELTAAPNPVFGRTELRFALPGPGRVQLVLYDVTGRVARRLLDEPRPAGSHRLALSSAGLAHGVYLARLTLATPDGVRTAEHKILVAR